MTELECIPFGTGHAKEGVCFLLRMGPYRILCDCGLVDMRSLLLSSPTPFVSESTSESTLEPAGIASAATAAAVDPNCPADFAFCSHAHADHARGLLSLHAAFPRLPVYASEVTTHLLPLNWSSDLAQQHATTRFCHPLPWCTATALAPDLKIELYPAGHLPGAAACLLTYTPLTGEGRDYTVLYTGDFLLSNSRLVDGLPLSELRGLTPDVLILEGSFGTARHPHRRQQENQFAARVMQALREGQSVLMPVPVLGLAQELLMLMRSHHTFTGKNLDIWVEDSIAQGCDAYLELLPKLPPTIQNFAQHQALFWDERVRPRVRRLSSSNLQKKASGGRQTSGAPRSPHLEHPCIVLTDETVDVKYYCNNDNDSINQSWLILVPEDRPRDFLASGREGNVSDDFSSGKASQKESAQPLWNTLIESETIQIDTFLLAEHCDGSGTTQLIHNLRPQHVVFMHGSPAYLTDLISLEELANRYHLHCPRVGNRLELPIGEGLIQPAISTGIDIVFDGEIHELGTEVAATFPQQITEDPRWRSFADTGLIEATWQGELLVLRGISQRELLMKTRRANSSDRLLQGCINCKHYRNQRCCNQRSSLYGSKVAPEGYCPVFEPSQIVPDLSP
jgi:Cft2 family RNA processing exonuclease